MRFEEEYYLNSFHSYRSFHVFFFLPSLKCLLANASMMDINSYCITSYEFLLRCALLELHGCIQFCLANE